MNEPVEWWTMETVAMFMGLENPESHSSRRKAIYFLQKKQREKNKVYLQRVGKEFKISKEHVQLLVKEPEVEICKNEIDDTLDENKYQIEQLQRQITDLRRRVGLLEWNDTSRSNRGND